MTLLRILAATWVAATTFPASAADEDYLSPSALAPAGLVKFWQLKLPLEADQRLADAYLVDDQLYLATQDGYVFAVHADTGAGRWMRRVTAGGFRIKRPAHAGNRVIFNTSTQLLVLDRYSGLALAESELGFPAGSAAVTDGVNIFLGGLNQRFYCFDVDSLFEIWKASTNGPINSAPVVKDGHLYVASNDSGVYACVAANKQFFWQTTTTGANTADLVADNIGVYVASRDLSLYFFDLRFGRIRWRARFSGPLYEPPVLTPDVAYQYCPDDGVVAVSTKTAPDEKRFRWKLPRGRKLLTVDSRHAFVLSRDQVVLVVGLKDGQIAHTIPSPGFTLPMPATKDTAIFLANPDGRIFCARQRGVPPVRRADLLKALQPPAGHDAAAHATTQPAGDAQPAGPEAGRPRRPIRTVGGKSKVTKQLESGSGGGGGNP